MTESITATYPRRTSDWLKHETDVAMSREVVTLAAGSGKVDTGTVLGKVTATEKFVPCKDDATDGSEVPAAILFRFADATDVDKSVVVVSGFAEVVMAEMIFDASFDDGAKKKAAMAVLAGKFIKNRAVA